MNSKEVKKTLSKNVNKAKKRGAELEGAAKKEMEKIHKHMEATSKKAGAYIKKNPEKAAVIAASVGAALGTVAGLFMKTSKKKKKKK
jgi:ElaB/YqjD/DUF883 family membrane-anchored ribosome-binding protein